MKPRYSKHDVRTLIDHRHAGWSWASTAAQLGRDEDGVRAKARRLRDAGKWLLANGKPADGAPEVGSGRPRVHVDCVDVSFRVSLAVSETLRDMEHAADVALLEIVRTALERGTKRTKTPPFGLDPGKSVALEAGTLSETFTLPVPSELLERYLAKCTGATPTTTAVREAVHAMLRDLNYVIEGDE